MKRWQQHKYYELAEEHNWLPPASHCSKRYCLDHDCPVNKEMMKKLRSHYTGVQRKRWRSIQKVTG